MKKIFIIAGEASGDSHAGAVINKLRKLNPGIQFYGIGGRDLEKEGVELLFRYDEVNFIGFTSVLMNLPAIRKRLNEAVAKVKETDPDIIILVDFPGFNIKFAELVRKFYTGKIVYFISPQVWAWHKGRVRKMKNLVDEMLVVFPFEVAFYNSEGMKVKYVGHPLVESINEFLDKNQKEKNDRKVITLLPGSRKEEIKRILPGLLKSAQKLRNDFGAEINIISPPTLDKGFYKEMIQGYNINIITDDENKDKYYKTICNSDIVFTKAGTPTMECALIGTPFCVVYKAGRLNYLIGKSMIKVNHIAMPNILMGKEVVKEFIQNDMTPGNLYTEGSRILSDEAYRTKMLDNFKELKKLLTDKSASDTSAEIINSML